MSEISGTMSNSLWQRFFNRADVNADGAVSEQELQSISEGSHAQEKAASIFAALDVDGDGQVSQNELPQSPIDTKMLRPLLNAQEFYALSDEEQAADEKAVVQTLFDRADMDGDGVLSQEEWDADKTLHIAAFLERGMDFNDPIFSVREGADPDHLTPDDFGVARFITGLKAIKPEEMPAELRERFESVKLQTAEMEADMVEKYGVDWHTKLTGLVKEDPIVKLQEQVQQAAMTSAMMSRLFAQLTASVLSPDPVDFTA